MASSWQAAGLRKQLTEIKAKVRRLETEAQAMEVDEPTSADESDESDDETRKALAFEVRPRRDERGRWQAEDEDLHACRLAQLARGVAASTVPANVQDILELIAPQLEIPSPCKRSSQLQRGEATLCGEAMAAWKFAACKRVMSVGWDESTKFGNAVFAINCQLEMYDGTIEDVCLRGLTILPEGGTSAAVLNHIERRIFAYSRRILQLWIDEYEKLHKAGSWAAAGYPSPENIGLHRLCEDTVLMTDTCNGARCTKRMCAPLPRTRLHSSHGALACVTALAPHTRSDQTVSPVSLAGSLRPSCGPSRRRLARKRGRR